MNASRSIVLLTGALAIAGCAPEPVGTLEQAPTLTLRSLDVSSSLDAGVPYVVSLPYEVAGEGTVQVEQACFTWSGEGPYCFPVEDSRERGMIRAELHTNNPGTYLLAGEVQYVANGYSKTSNNVSAEIDVR